MSYRPWAVVGLLLCAPALVHGQTPVQMTVVGNQATGRIQLGLLGADLTVRFEQADGLTPAALGAFVRPVDPLDAALLSRLPAGAAIPVGFPVLLQVEPPPAGGLSFRGLATVELYTHNLDYPLGSRLVLYSAHQGGPFHDITRSAAAGSYRCGGSSGTFSEFLIVVDPRPVDGIIGEKYDRLQQALDSHGGAMPADLLADLQARLAASRQAYLEGRTADAMAALDGFSGAVLAASGAAIPDVWRADGTATNVAGTLRSGAETLRFSLDWKAAHP